MKFEPQTFYCGSNHSGGRSYLHLPFDEGGNVVLVLKDGESLQQVVFQPLPVLRDLFMGRSCRVGEEWKKKNRLFEKFWASVNYILNWETVKYEHLKCAMQSKTMVI